MNRGGNLAEIVPFHGVRYNPDIVKDLASVICPPYDIISRDEQKALYEKSEYNVIRLEYGMDLPDDSPDNNKHTRARVTFDQWLKSGVLIVDHVPSLYILEHTFTYQNTRKRRLGFTACVRLEPWEKKVVLPHENTIAGIKSDRLDLMRACAANFSPIMGLYEDPGQKIAKLLTTQTSRKPAVEFTTNGETLKLWIAKEPEFIQRISHFLSPKPIYIADGHHRYETALAYQAERRQNTSSASGHEAFNFVMMTLVSLSDPGLIVLPVHRLIKGISVDNIKWLTEELTCIFQMERTPFAGGNNLPEMKGTIARVIGLQEGYVVGLKLRPDVSLKELMPEGRSDIYIKLDASIVQHLIIDRLGAIDKNVTIAYTPNTEAAIRMIENGDYQIALILNPISLSTIKGIADAGDKMPGKSTYFYPKLPTGLVINRLEGTL